MSLTRRRFLTLTAAATLAGPSGAAPLTPVRWRGVAMGADCDLTIYAAPAQAEAAIRQIRALLSHVESRFSLYDPTSELSRLNRSGRLAPPSPEMVRLLARAGRVHSATRGRFDPTVQPLWRALATGADPRPAQQAIGWHKVSVSPDRVTLAPGQALTLNGIAQGYATDRARDMLRDLGLPRVLINLGEFSAVGGPFRLGLSDPTKGLFATRPLADGAIATSSPAALRLGKEPHILDPLGLGPLWSTVSVEARSAATADAASTAFCLMSGQEIRSAIGHLPDITRVTLLPETGPAQVIDA